MLVSERPDPILFFNYVVRCVTHVHFDGISGSLGGMSEPSTAFEPPAERAGASDPAQGVETPRASSKQAVAGPPGLPFLGHILEFRTDALGFLTRCARRHGDVVALRLGGQAAYLVNRPDHIEEILVRRGSNFVKTSNSGESPKRRRGPVDLMDWIRNFPSDGEAWMPDRALAQPTHRERKQMLPAFQSRSMDGYAKSMVTLTGDVVRGWTSDETRPMNRDMHRLSLRIVAQTLFGVSVDNDATLVEAFGIVLDRITRQMRFPYQLPV
ncbi:MAG: cytochrome P450, partial [Acidobacteriaceae bacterium]|nr:cytochrome P450 [Acidobacteriaceae bacterium]